MRRRQVEYEQGEGLDLAVQTVSELRERTFKVLGLESKHTGIDGDEITRFIQKELPSYYAYTTKVKRHFDRRGIHHTKVEMVVNIRVTRALNRYNPLNKTFRITTEKPKPDVQTAPV